MDFQRQVLKKNTSKEIRLIIKSGLVNGAQGIVKKIWFQHGKNPKKDLPAVIWVDVKGYTGNCSSFGNK